jgi:ABC-type ATPase involved in cell division
MQSEELAAMLKECKLRVQELEHLYELSSNVKSKQTALQKLEQEKKLHTELVEDIKRNDYQVNLVISTATKIFQQGKAYNEAERESIQEISNSNLYYDQYSIGTELFNYIPRFVFFEDFSGLLPNKIDLEDILNENSHVEGYKAALNFITVSGLEISFFREKNNRILKQRIEALNTDLTINFQDYWSQQVGKDNKIKMQFELEHYDYTVPEKSGKPYIEFWIKDNQERLYPKQRSRGVRWFLSFYLELKAAALNADANLVLLIDEPGLSLHARAQEDVLKVFEDLKDKLQIIYCTHSPHLVKTEKLYRILAVQRADDDDDKSETLLFDPSKLSMATADTLTPIYSLMGIRLSDQQLMISKNNIIVPDIITYYYLHWLSKLSSDISSFRFIPATGLNTVPLLVNIMSGWQVNFGVILFGSKSLDVYNELKEVSLLGINGSSSRILLYEQFDTIEDIFSPVDFKKFVLQQRVGITEKNSEFISLNSLSRKVLATNFVNNYTEGKIKMSEFDETTQKNLHEVFTQLQRIVNINSSHE